MRRGWRAEKALALRSLGVLDPACLDLGVYPRSVEQIAEARQ